jgi:hypothetical protein
MHRALSCFVVLFVACGGASTSPTEPSTQSSARPSASSAPSTSVASAAPIAPDVRPPPPENFRALDGEGFSIYVPSAWKPLQAAPGAVAFASYGGTDGGMSLQIAKVAFTGAESEFIAGVTKGVVGTGGVETSSSTITIAGRPTIVTAFTHTKPGPKIRGAMRALTGTDHVVLVMCHTAETSWNDKARAACDPMFSSIRVGAASQTNATAPAGKRFLSGADFRVAVPADWTDDTPHTPEVRALARSSNDEETMIVVTIAEITPDAKPTPTTRDAMLAKVVAGVLAKEGTHGSIKHTAPNAVDVDFTRQVEGQTTALVNAHFFGTDGAYLVTCGGLRASMEAHHDICETAVRSVRVAHPK